MTTAAYLIWSHLTQAQSSPFVSCVRFLMCVDMMIVQAYKIHFSVFSQTFIQSHLLCSFPSSFITLYMMHLVVRVHVYATAWLSYSFCTTLTSNFHFHLVEEAMSAKKKALSVCDLHMVPHQTQRTGIFRKHSVDCVYSLVYCLVMYCVHMVMFFSVYSRCWHMYIS